MENETVLHCALCVSDEEICRRSDRMSTATYIVLGICQTAVAYKKVSPLLKAMAVLNAVGYVVKLVRY